MPGGLLPFRPAPGRRNSVRCCSRAAIGLYEQLAMHVLNPDSDAPERAAAR